MVRWIRERLPGFYDRGGRPQWLDHDGRGIAAKATSTARGFSLIGTTTSLSVQGTARSARYDWGDHPCSHPRGEAIDSLEVQRNGRDALITANGRAVQGRQRIWRSPDACRRRWMSPRFSPDTISASGKSRRADRAGHGEWELDCQRPGCGVQTLRAMVSAMTTMRRSVRESNIISQLPALSFRHNHGQRGRSAHFGFVAEEIGFLNIMALWLRVDPVIRDAEPRSSKQRRLPPPGAKV